MKFLAGVGWLCVGLIQMQAMAVSFEDERQQYNDCVLQYVSPAEEPAAITWLLNACRELYLDNILLTDKDKAYYQCLLDFMSQSSRLEATLSIKQACQDKHRSFLR
ncbi:VF_A0006 family four-cysteine protein [Photobacterium sp. 1_MG-2023]|uniref:VF_A0006 family four-cysteine protein n=1 Tax=Photobacterium sp. 1_MG-2023 TaxID=3062646 RepID=UPI0026E48022|nr:VF_A0006 family four-cysteine protein [Photobacterium sp. 1_MG-2023]MDO6705738.1 VF_A0006 family four-cysteine protein [Photobacterium sp. 1_MG-2023]